MNYLKHGNTTILSDEGMEDWVIHLITQCIDFNVKMTHTKIVLLKDSCGHKNNTGLAIVDIEGFVIHWKRIISVSEEYKRQGVAPIATLVHSIVDVVFHEMHHIESYHEDVAWTFSHREEEEKNANMVARDLSIDFFKNVKLEVPMQDTPYIYKSDQLLVTNLREYFNLILGDDEQWDSLPDITTKVVASEDIGVIEPSENTSTIPREIPATITSEQATALYLTCFDKIFNGCGPTTNGFDTPEKILEPVESQGIVAYAKKMNNAGVVQELPVVQSLSGMIFKSSKLPAYEFTLIDGKKRLLLPQNPTKVDNSGNLTPSAMIAQSGVKLGWIIDVASDEYILKYENGILSNCY